MVLFALPFPFPLPGSFLFRRPLPLSLQLFTFPSAAAPVYALQPLSLEAGQQQRCHEDHLVPEAPWMAPAGFQEGVSPG
jgi:hypothetical protein